jgi:hypothetical protein
MRLLADLLLERVPDNNQIRCLRAGIQREHIAMLAAEQLVVLDTQTS